MRTRLIFHSRVYFSCLIFHSHAYFLPSTHPLSLNPYTLSPSPSLNPYTHLHSIHILTLTQSIYSPSLNLYTQSPPLTITQSSTPSSYYSIFVCVLKAQICECGLISADRSNKATLPLTIPRSPSSRLHAIHLLWSCRCQRSLRSRAVPQACACIRTARCKEAVSSRLARILA